VLSTSTKHFIVYFSVEKVPMYVNKNSFIKHFRTMSLIIPGTFQHILRVMNTNIDGKRNIMFAMTAIKGCGRRYANLVLKKVRLIFFNFLCICIGELKNPSFIFLSKWSELSSIWASVKFMELDETKRIWSLSVLLVLKNYQIHRLFWSKFFVIKSQKYPGIKKVNKCNEYC
jgi:hypothetical protein